MNILLVSRGIPDADYPLNGIFEFDNAKALATAGHHVTMLAIDFRSGKDKRRYGLYRYTTQQVNVCVLSLPLNCYRRARPVLSALTYIAYKNAVRHFGKPDIIHAHFYFMAAIAAILPRMTHIPYVVTEHSSKLNKPLADISALDQRITRAAYRHANRIVCVSNALAERLRENFSVDCAVIPNIVDTETITYAPRQNDKQTFRFCSIGNLVSGKRFDLLVDAFAEAFRQDETTMLDIIGDGTERVNLQQRIASAGMAGRIILHGLKTRAEVAEILHGSDAFVLLSDKETFGVAYVEALLAGRPVIATACGGPQDFITADNGLLIPVNDKNAAIQALKQLRTHANDYDGEAISQKCRAKFSPAAIARQLSALYDSLRTAER